MNWTEVCEHPQLRNLAFKIELDEYGNVVMSPARVAHSALQGEIEYLLRSLLGHGKTLPECAVATAGGTKVADVAWLSAERFARVRNDVECSVAPEVCVEIISASNSLKEMATKQALYLQAGAREFWTCDEQGRMRFYDPSGELRQSSLVKQFPNRVVI